MMRWLVVGNLTCASLCFILFSLMLLSRQAEWAMIMLLISGWNAGMARRNFLAYVKEVS